MTEEWRAIPGYEGYYEASSIGRIRSVPRTITAMRDGKKVTWKLQSKLIKPRPSTFGYLLVTLSVNAVHRHLRVHRLVLEAFVGSCPDGMEALHANDVRDDNRLENLRWGTRSDNLHDMVRNGRHRAANKTHCKRGHEFTSENIKPQSGGRSGRGCRQCSKDDSKRRYAKNRDAIRAQQNARSARIRSQRTQVAR